MNGSGFNFRFYLMTGTTSHVVRLLFVLIDGKRLKRPSKDSTGIKLMDAMNHWWVQWHYKIRIPKPPKQLPFKWWTPQIWIHLNTGKVWKWNGKSPKSWESSIQVQKQKSEYWTKSLDFRDSYFVFCLPIQPKSRPFDYRTEVIDLTSSQFRSLLCIQNPDFFIFPIPVPDIMI